MNRQEKLLRIGTMLARFVAEVKIFNEGNLYDINIHAENVLIPILNEVFGVSVENLNVTQKKNYPAIDLADFNGRVAFQVTSSSSITKLNDTFDLFKENNLDKKFDILYFYILTEKQSSYSSDSLEKHIPRGYEFDQSKHIIDNSGLFNLIKNLTSSSKIDTIDRILVSEFSEAKIELRRLKFEQKFLKTTPENIYTNLLRISFPQQFYIADISFNKEQAISRINEWLGTKGIKPQKKFKAEKLFKNALRHHRIFFQDFIHNEGKILTFRNLHSTNEPLRNIIDAGTITAITCEEFYTKSEDKLNLFKWLLKQNLVQYVHLKEMEWINDGRFVRFKKDKIAPRKKQKNWKGLKESTKTVIFEVHNKKLGHIICFRHLAFIPSFELLDSEWYMVVNPTWSFTNPYSWKTSRYEPYYMSGLKRMENNQAVYYFYRFFEHYLSHVDLFTEEYEFLNISSVQPLTISPSLDDTKWRPLKHEDISNLAQEGLEQDNELNLTLFD
ncbi:MAG: SMEK domain-containing protein [Bacteroidota bacterium]|jgi:hypothetical protein